MVTTRRSSTNTTSSVFDNSTAGGVGVLERKSNASRNEFVNISKEETVDEARERMRGNLNMLLNYDRSYEEVTDSVASPVVEDAPVEVSEPVAVAEPVNFQDEDIRPTSTTMQFGDGDVDQMYNEMRKEEHEETSYRLNGKGKLVLVLYALAVTVILALIIINTGVLAGLSGAKAAKTAELSSKIEQYQQLSANIEDISSEGYIIGKAEELGMIKR